MIEAISGQVESLTPVSAVIATASGISFGVNITLPTFTALEGKDRATLLIHESIREDAWTLYGFLTEKERELFRLLLGVSGVGASTARMILSAINAEDLSMVIASGDAQRLRAVKGVGAKTAERVIVDLRDKIKGDPLTLLTKSTTAASAAYDEALEALVILGFPRPASIKALRKLYDEQPEMPVEQAVKRAMSML